MLLLYRGDGFDANFYHNCGLDIDHSFLLESENGKGRQRVLFTSIMNASLAKASFKGKVIVYTNLIKDIAPYIKGRRVKFDGNSMRANLAKRLGSVCKLVDCSQELLVARSTKRNNEIACIRKAVAHTKSIFDSLDFKSAKTEAGLAKQLLLATYELGFEPAFDPIVATDKNTAFPHSIPTAKKLGSLVMVDYGVRYGHYCSDLTRCFILDGDKKKKEQYARLKDICYFIADSLPSLKTGKDVALLAADLLAKAGFPKMPHSAGHGVGLDIHEFPRLSERYKDKVAGAVVAIEPAFYFAGKYGMRYEETVDFTGKTARIL